jgi:hypothetical protein
MTTVVGFDVPSAAPLQELKTYGGVGIAVTVTLVPAS